MTMIVSNIASTIVDVCQSCTVLLVNNDDTHMDEARATYVENALDMLGGHFTYLPASDEADDVFDCFVCDESHYATPNRMAWATRD